MTGVVFGQAPDPGSASVRGLVTDEKNHPVSGAKIILQSDRQTFSYPTDSHGSYLFSALPDGDYVISAQMPGYDSASSSFHLKPAETKLLDVRLEIHASAAKGTLAPSASEAQFYDEPKFNVAGVTDATNYGGHGSNDVSRNRDAVARATVSMSKESTKLTSNRDSATEASLRRTAEANGNFESSWELGKFLAKGGKDREALPYIKRASELVESDRPASEKAEVHHLLADVEENLGDPLAAVKQYQSAAEIDPTEFDLFDWGAELLLHRAFQPALEVFTNASQRFPNSVRLRIGVGATWYALGSYEKGEHALFEASDLQPDDPNPYLFLGKMQTDETTASQQCVEKFARFVTLQPQNAMANYYYAVALWKSRQNRADVEARVESLLEKAIELDPRLGPAYLQLGIVHADQKDFANAVSCYKKAVEADPNMEDAHYRLALAYTRLGEKEQVQQEFRLYEKIRKETTERTEQERRELRQFVYTLKTPARSAQQ